MAVTALSQPCRRSQQVGAQCGLGAASLVTDCYPENIEISSQTYSRSAASQGSPGWPRSEREIFSYHQAAASTQIAINVCKVVSHITRGASFVES